MKPILIPITLASVFALAACERPTVVAVPTPAPAPATTPVPGPPGPQGDPGKPGTMNVIITPAASAASS